MKTFTKTEEYDNYLRAISSPKSIGFVPTMGVLHAGHLTLIRRAKQENDQVVCSIFVNPTQFNDTNDLKEYPRTLKEDTVKLISTGCDVMFVPNEKEVYPYADSEKEKEQYDFGELENTMEGKMRPGHFKGVALVVNKLFQMIHPNIAYFGEKDFQQLAIIRALTSHRINSPIIVACPTVREKDGLAMSSRNIFLSSIERKEATQISATLFEARTQSLLMNPPELKQWAIEKLSESPLMQVEYFELVDSTTLRPVKNWKDAISVRACVAVKIGKTRLIDNMEIQIN